MHEITANTTSLAKKEQRQTNKQENFYSKKESKPTNQIKKTKKKLFEKKGL
jgi:hypothetical protein